MSDKKITITPVSKAVPFDNTTNGFTATDAQAAIEEAKQNAEGFPRAGIRSTQNGTVSANQWLGPTELHPNTPMLVAPVTLKINEITWSNQNTNVEFRIQFRVGSKTGTIFYTLDVNPTNPGYGYVTGIDYTLNPGDTVWAQYLDDGANCADMDIILWVSRVGT